MLEVVQDLRLSTSSEGKYRGAEATLHHSKWTSCVGTERLGLYLSTWSFV